MTAALRSLVLAAGLALLPGAAAAQLKVVTSTTDLWDLARQVGGDRVTATHISEGYQDPHFVEAKPSFILELRRADVWAYVGLDLEIGWASLLVNGARNRRIQAGAPGHIDVSRVIPVLDVPGGRVDRSQGDVHPLGNPHYWLDPANARRIVRLFEDVFRELDPAGTATYQRNADRYLARLDSAEAAWQPQRLAIRNLPVVAWHTSWRYFARYGGLDIVGFMEPKPGVPPSPGHLAGLIQTMRRTGTKLIIMEPFYDRKTADFVASRTGATVLVLPPSVGGLPGITDYLRLMKHNLDAVAAAAGDRQAGGSRSP